MTPVAHTAFALLGWHKAASTRSTATLFCFILAANLPDIDFLLFSRHQYYTHNIFFAIFVALLFFPIFKTHRERIALIVVSLSHLLLDLIIIDRVVPIGIPLFFPLDRSFYNAGFFPNFERGGIMELLTFHNGMTLLLENLLFLLPVLIIYRKDFRKYLSPKKREQQ